MSKQFATVGRKKSLFSRTRLRQGQSSAVTGRRMTAKKKVKVSIVRQNKIQKIQ